MTPPARFLWAGPFVIQSARSLDGRTIIIVQHKSGTSIEIWGSDEREPAVSKVTSDRRAQMIEAPGQ